MQQPPSSVQKTQSPALFLQKLRKILEDASTNDDIVKWNPTGDGFVIQDQAKFSFQILPKYYSHNNLCSFVRQLNMYGFHKVMLLETKDRNQIEYTHRYFSRDEPDLMGKIERKPAPSTKTVLKDFEQIRGCQVEMDGKLEALQQENALLWREVAALRQKHLTQQELVNKIIEFLVAVIQTNDRRGAKRKGGLLLESPAASSKKIGMNDQSCVCGNSSATVALLDNSMAVDEATLDSQGDEHGLDELSGILNEWNENNLEAEVLDLDQLIDGIDGNLEAEQGKSEEVQALDSSCSELLTEGPAYLDL